MAGQNIHMADVWFRIVSLFLTLNISAGVVTNVSWFEYSEIGSSASLVYNVRGIRTYEVPDISKCSLDSKLYNCSTPTGPCGDNGRTQLVLSKKFSSRSWHCPIHNTNVTEDDVGEYFLCQLDTSSVSPECRNVHRTYLHAWYINGNNEICNITYDKGTKTKNCPSPVIDTTNGTTVGSPTSRTTSGVIHEAETRTRELDTNIIGERQRDTSGKTIPVVVGVVIFAVVLVVLGVIFVRRRRRRRLATARSCNGTPACEVPLNESV